MYGLILGVALGLVTGITIVAANWGALRAVHKGSVGEAVWRFAVVAAIVAGGLVMARVNAWLGGVVIIAAVVVYWAAMLVLRAAGAPGPDRPDAASAGVDGSVRVCRRRCRPGGYSACWGMLPASQLHGTQRQWPVVVSMVTMMVAVIGWSFYAWRRPTLHRAP